MPETLTPETLAIDARFCGPPGTGNGGYVCGRLAALVGDTAEVTLRRPPPLERALRVERGGDGVVTLHDGATLIAEARPSELALDAPAAPDHDAAAAASRSYLGFAEHGFPACFVCGPTRPSGDGLRIFAGPLAGDGKVAAPWHPDASLADRDGLVRPEFVWAALDCPGAFALMAGVMRPMLLGRMSARTIGRVGAGERCTVMAWKIASDGRKSTAGSAVFGEHGDLRGLARATWFAMAP